jgi:hypothetical protein
MGEHALFVKLFWELTRLSVGRSAGNKRGIDCSLKKSITTTTLHPLFTLPHRNCAPPNTIRVSFMNRQARDAQVIRDIRNDQHYKACIRHNRDHQHYQYKFLDVLGRMLNQRWSKPCVKSVTQSQGAFPKNFTGQTGLACWHQGLQQCSIYTPDPTLGRVGWLRAR